MIGREPIVLGAVASALMVMVGLFGSTLDAQRRGREERTVWDGVFSADQARRGQLQYEGNCAGCHGDDLGGGDDVPALAGEPFIRNWEAETLDRLFEKIRDSMPRNGPETVSDEGKLDVVAYLLQANAHPTGSAELSLEDGVLEGIRIVREGAEQVPDFALVQVVGCLTEADGVWTLFDTTEAVLTKEDTPSDAALKAAEGASLGTETFSLLSVAPFDPDSQRGHKMEARGLLRRTPRGNQLDLVSLRMVSAACAN